MTLTAPASFEQILETVLYSRGDDFEQTVSFYENVPGLKACRALDGKAGIYRVGGSILLIFDADETETKTSPPPTGTSGRGHTCFRVESSQYEIWKNRLQAQGVEIIDEIEWETPLSGRSFYLHDPAGNVLEIADRDIWP